MEAEFRRVYELEQSLIELERKQTLLKISVSKAKYDLRSAKADVLEYEGSFRSFLDRFRGIKETRSEQLHRMLRHAEETLPPLEQELVDVQNTIAYVKSELAELPSVKEIHDCREKHLMEVSLCLCALSPMLEETLQALLDCRTLVQGQRVGELISVEERQEILSRPHTVAAMCVPWLQRLENALLRLDIPFQIPDFYCNPAGYLAVTQYTYRDRLNTAVDQTVLLKQLLPRFREIIE